MATKKSRPAVSALGIRWRLGRPPGRRALAAVVAAAGVDARPFRGGTAPRAVRIKRGQAAWMLGGRVAVAAPSRSPRSGPRSGPEKPPQSGGPRSGPRSPAMPPRSGGPRSGPDKPPRSGGGGVVVVAGSVARVAVAGRPVWVGPGEAVTVAVEGPGPWRVEAAAPPRCTPVVAKRAGLADALLEAPGVNLAVTETTAPGGWTDAVVVAAGGDFVCACGARFASIGAINDHYAVRLIGDHYAPMLPEAPDQRPAGVYTPPAKR